MITVTKEDPLIMKAAKAAHDMNRYYCQIIGDFSQYPWDAAAEDQRKSCIAGVKAIVANPEITPKLQHEAWAEYKKAEGWVYGRVKNATAKTHPCLVPYEELPHAERAKDAIFGAVVRGVLGIEPDHGG